MIVHLLDSSIPYFPCHIIRLLPAIYVSISYTEIDDEFALKLDDQCQDEANAVDSLPVTRLTSKESTKIGTQDTSFLEPREFFLKLQRGASLDVLRRFI